MNSKIPPNVMPKNSGIIFTPELAVKIKNREKTQTRRIVNKRNKMKCPYGVEGDRLWVRETWRPLGWSEDGDDWVIQYKDGTKRRVMHLFDDGDKEYGFWVKLCHLLNKKGVRTLKDVSRDELINEELIDPDDPDDWVDGDQYFGPDIHKHSPWRPAIFMPRNASRMTLQVEKATIEPVMGITNSEIIAEGVGSKNAPWGKNRGDFLDLWDSINGKGNFMSNPLVWVIQFELINLSN